MTVEQTGAGDGFPLRSIAAGSLGG